MVSRAEQRAVLRRFTAGDRENFVEMNRDPRVMRYFPSLLTAEESDAAISLIGRHWDVHGFGPWVLDVEGEFAGVLGLLSVRDEMPFAPAVELLYRLLPRFWGQGLATDGSRAALEFGFGVMGLERMVAYAVAGNKGSRRVMEKIGMVYQGDFDHPVLEETSALRRHALYEINRGSWRAIESRVGIEEGARFMGPT